jgi:hypothetical protein
VRPKIENMFTFENYCLFFNGFLSVRLHRAVINLYFYSETFPQLKQRREKLLSFVMPHDKRGNLMAVCSYRVFVEQGDKVY